MNKEEAIKKINESDTEDFQVFSTEEHTTYLDNFAKQNVDSKLAEEVRKIHNRYDDDLFELFGERKPTNEKTYNFLKRKVSETKEQAKTAETYKSKIDELTKALENNTGDEQLKRDLATVKKAYEDEKKSWSQKEQEFATKLDTYKLETELDKGLTGLKFSDSVPEDVRSVFIANVKADLIKSAKIVDGKMIFVGEDGNTLVNKDNALNPYTPSEMLSKKLESILSQERKIDGPPKPKTEVIDGKEVLILSNPNAKTRAEVSEYLKKNGIANSSPEYMKMYAEFTKDLPAIQ